MEEDACSALLPSVAGGGEVSSKTEGVASPRQDGVVPQHSLNDMLAAWGEQMIRRQQEMMTQWMQERKEERERERYGKMAGRTKRR